MASTERPEPEDYRSRAQFDAWLRDWLALPDEFKQNIVSWAELNARIGAGQVFGLRVKTLTTAQFAALTPYPDQQVVVQLSGGELWQFRYDAESASASKWSFLSGSPLVAVVAANESTSSSSYAALATAGPSVTLPFAGDYLVEHGSYADTGVTSGGLACHSYDIGGSAAADGDRVAVGTNVAETVAGSVARKAVKTGLTAASLVSKYKSTSGTTVAFSNRWMSVTPIRVSQS